jgi:hypothetical protein
MYSSSKFGMGRYGLSKACSVPLFFIHLNQCIGCVGFGVVAVSVKKSDTVGIGLRHSFVVRSSMKA